MQRKRHYRLITTMEDGDWQTVTDGTANIIAEALDVTEETLFTKIPNEPKSNASDTNSPGTSHPAIGKQRMKKVLLLSVVLGLVLWASYQFYPHKQQNDITDLAHHDITKLPGCWNWSNGDYIVIDSDGSAHLGLIGAIWKTIDMTKGQYQITWPSFVDTLTLSANDDTLSGTNNYGFPVSATRKSGAKPDLVGSWLWMSGVTVDIRSDFSFSGGPLKGTWRKAGNNWILEWPLVDTVTLSKNGLTLSAKNQFGSVTAKRDVDCKGG